MEQVGLDVLGPFATTDNGNRYVLVAMKYFTTWPQVGGPPPESFYHSRAASVNNVTLV